MFRKLLIFSILFLLVGTISAQEAVYLWQGQDVHNGKQVTLTPFLAENNTDGTAIIVCPGGSYFWLDEDNEGDNVARWLNSNGISAFVLRYRVAGIREFIWHYRRVFRGNQHPDMLDDAQRAIVYVKEHSEEYNIDPNRLGIMGFSAGGHLSMSTACYFTNDENRPAFAAPIYPVVTMEDPYVHERSRRALLGDRRCKNQIMQDSMSLERHVPDNCPPIFIVNCVDDDIVDYQNSVMLDSALNAKNINHKYVQYQTGGHGFGASETRGTEESRQWKNEFLEWLEEVKL